MMFDSTPIFTLDELSTALVQGLPQELSDPDAKDRLWTRVITDSLCEMGTRRGFLACGHGSKDNGEWLLDVVWMGRERHEVVFAAESEWGKPGDIEDDFDKLMSIKAHDKLMLFTTFLQDSPAVVERLESALLKYPYHIEGEEYMALNVTKDAALRYHFRAPGDGRLHSVSFTEMTPLQWPWPSAVR
jgi:hypothetical protein